MHTQTNTSGTTYTHTQVGGQTVQIESGGHTTLKGAVVSANQVSATVGGNLHIETVQDSNRYDERQRNAGFNVSVPIGPGTASGSLNAGRTDIRSTYQSATEQSGIRAGDGGFQVKVDGDTTLVGAAITSSQAAQDAGVNQLQTATLSSSDLHNTASASASSSGISLGTDMVNQGRYGLAKTGVANLANQASDQTQQQGQTISAISSANIVITDKARHQALTNEAPEQTAERLQANAQGPTHTGVSAADVQAMRRQVETDRVIKNEAVKQFSIIGDQVYRKETEDKTVHLMQCETATKERCGVSEVVSLEQVRAVNNAITAFNNGMLNTEEQALMTAYMQASGVQMQDGILVIVNPRIDNIVAESTWVVYKKVQEVFGFGSSSVGELNLALESIAAAQGAQLNTIAHSAGNFGVAEMNRRLEDTDRTNAAIGAQTMFGSPVNAQSQADRVHAITGGHGTVQQSTHVNDFVSTLFGNNPPTGGNPQTGALSSHSAYTGDLTTSESRERQLPLADLISPQELRERTDAAWGAGQFSQPETVAPRNQIEPNEGN
jgi:filamentous hemagglutinin